METLEPRARRGDQRDRAGAELEPMPEVEEAFEEIEVDAPARRDHHGLGQRQADDAAGRRGAARARHPLRGARAVGPPRSRGGRRLRAQRAHARPAGDHRRRRHVGGAARRRRRAHRPAGDRRPDQGQEHRRRRPRRAAVDRADAARRAGRVRRDQRRAQRGRAGRAHPRAAERRRDRPLHAPGDGARSGPSSASSRPGSRSSSPSARRSPSAA